jgi:DNA-binding beta-propeller fold protein YncE
LADSIYWTNFADSAIRAAALAGGGNVDTLYDLAQGAAGPRGVAIDSAAGRIYWANQGDNRIRGAPLAGGTVDSLYGPGQVVGLPGGVAIDPAAGQIYWTNEDDNTIRGARLAGGGSANSLYDGPARGVNGPGGVAIDPAAGRIYWTNSEDNTIRSAPLAGGTASPLYGAAEGVSRPAGVAIDSAAGRIYWTNLVDNTIRGAPLAGGGPVDTLYGPAQGVSRPCGVAIDPPAAIPITLEPRPSTFSRWLGTAGGRVRNWLLGWLGRFPAGRIYWANDGDNTIRGASLAGGGSVDTLYGGSGLGVNWPRFLALLRVPLGTGAPAISGGGQLGQRLSCSRGAWAADLVGSFLYRAPQSFAYQWTLGGSDIGGATLAAYTPTAPGSYTCRVIATNRAGSTAQTSAAVAVS